MTDDSFHKISFDENHQENLPHIEKVKKPFPPIAKLISIFLVVFLLVTAALAVMLVVFGRNLYFDMQKTAGVAQETYSAVKNQDLETAKVKLKDLEGSLQVVKGDLAKLVWVSYIPWLGVYEKDFEHLINGGISGVQATQITVETLVPYADLLGLKGKSTFVAGSADERIKVAVETLDKVTPILSDIAGKIAYVGNELDQIDAGRYPKRLGSTVVRSKLQDAKSIFSQTAKLFVDAQPLLKQLPDLLGNKGAKTYLVLFQNDAELRATGGFITGYALFKVEKGKMQVIKADDIYKLDGLKKKTYPAPTPILKYHKDVFNFELRDSNLSPDFSESMKQFEKMVKESIPDFPEFDGIIAVDTHVLVSAIKILGEFNIYGRVFSADNDKRCDCPKAIYELEDYATRPVAYVREERKDIIGVLLYQIMQRALGISPSKYWGRLFQMALEEASQKHVLFYFHNTDAQKGIEAINFGGRIASTDGDYIHINDVNFAGAKSNMFIKESVKQEIKVGDDGSAVKTITISYKNPAPASNCNLEAGQLCLNGILRNWIRIYTPVGATLVEFKGSEKDTVTYEEMGKTVFEGFMTVKPQGAAEVQLTYRLPFKLKKGDLYKLLIQKQPGTDEPEYAVYYNGKQIDKNPLISDKNISFKL